MLSFLNLYFENFKYLSSSKRGRLLSPRLFKFKFVLILNIDKYFDFILSFKVFKIKIYKLYVNGYKSYMIVEYCFSTLENKELALSYKTIFFLKTGTRVDTRNEAQNA